MEKNKDGIKTIKENIKSYKRDASDSDMFRRPSKYLDNIRDVIYEYMNFNNEIENIEQYENSKNDDCDNNINN